MLRSLRGVMAAIVLLGCAASLGAEPRTYTVSLSNPRVSRLAAGRYVVSFEASGEIRGLLTLHINRSAGVVTGEWALVSRYLEDIPADPAAAAVAKPRSSRRVDARRSAQEAESHQEHVALVDRGTLSGSITKGSLTFVSTNRLDTLSLEISVTGGSLAFNDAAGAGTATGGDLAKPAVGTGSLTVTLGGL